MPLGPNQEDDHALLTRGVEDLLCTPLACLLAVDFGSVPGQEPCLPLHVAAIVCIADLWPWLSLVAVN